MARSMAPPSGPTPCMAPSRLPMPAGRHIPAEPTEPGRPVEPIRSVRLLLLIAALALLQAAVAAIHPADLAVLHDLQHSLTNADVLAWPADTNPCAWPHISCDRAGRVNNMDLKNAGLAGRFPPPSPPSTRSRASASRTTPSPARSSGLLSDAQPREEEGQFKQNEKLNTLQVGLMAYGYRSENCNDM
ncbi:hypothetical protein GUJ93_ZPchr0001g31917 [Zizania palustris]|uniref:Leucine-rich repeat-containing N-terminal plant-type domain-containing protein n=1 Tax=Zizania palustris TaxID=103762 RepID=A0A8J5V0D1_ZIZPA|nr:hypothetical protein GUJ93_ZPchr0001g31917 [Zizania palustris]